MVTSLVVNVRDSVVQNVSPIAGARSDRRKLHHRNAKNVEQQAPIIDPDVVTPVGVELLYLRLKLGSDGEKRPFVGLHPTVAAERPPTATVEHAQG